MTAENGVLRRMREAPACEEHRRRHEAIMSVSGRSPRAVMWADCDACLDIVRRVALPDEPSEAAAKELIRCIQDTGWSIVVETAALMLRAAYAAEREGR